MRTVEELTRQFQAKRRAARARLQWVREKMLATPAQNKGEVRRGTLPKFKQQAREGKIRKRKPGIQSESKISEEAVAGAKLLPPVLKRRCRIACPNAIIARGSRKPVMASAQSNTWLLLALRLHGFRTPTSFVASASHTSATCTARGCRGEF